MANVTAKPRLLAVWISIGVLIISGCMGQHGFHQLRCKPSNCFYVVDAACYGYYPTCWRTWTDDCATCMPPVEVGPACEHQANIEPANSDKAKAEQTNLRQANPYRNTVEQRIHQPDNSFEPKLEQPRIQQSTVEQANPPQPEVEQLNVEQAKLYQPEVEQTKVEGVRIEQVSFAESDVRFIGEARETESPVASCPSESAPQDAVLEIPMEVNPAPLPPRKLSVDYLFVPSKKRSLNQLFATQSDLESWRQNKWDGEEEQ